EVPPWTTPEGTRAVVRELAARVRKAYEAPRERLLHLADELDAGRTTHRRPRQAEALEAARLAAVGALRAAAEQEPPPDAPDACGRPWLDWWWEQPGPAQDERLSELEAVLPALAVLLSLLAPENWGAGAPAPAAPSRISPPEPTPAPLVPVELNGH